MSNGEGVDPRPRTPAARGGCSSPTDSPLTVILHGGVGDVAIELDPDAVELEARMPPDYGDANRRPHAAGKDILRFEHIA